MAAWRLPNRTFPQKIVGAPQEGPAYYPCSLNIRLSEKSEPLAMAAA